jgi:hypothetical protein
MRFDSARVMETVERLSEDLPPRETVEPRTAALLAEGFERAGWRRANRPTGGQSPLVVALPSGQSSAACRVVFLSNLGAVPSFRLPLRFLLERGRQDEACSQTPRLVDCSGPALLLEMARAWPKGWSERFEPALAAAGGMNLGFAGVRELVRLIREEWTEKPTLLVVILAPGVGQELTIYGRPKSLLRMVSEAAESLWIPVRTVGRRAGALIGRGWPIPSKFCNHIVLTGASYRDEKPPPVDPAALARAAQLASEIALRWVKQQNEQAV